MCYFLLRESKGKLAENPSTDSLFGSFVFGATAILSRDPIRLTGSLLKALCSHLFRAFRNCSTPWTLSSAWAATIPSSKHSARAFPRYVCRALRQRSEQLIRALTFHKLGLVRVIAPHQLTPETLITQIIRAL